MVLSLPAIGEIPSTQSSMTMANLPNQEFLTPGKGSPTNLDLTSMDDIQSIQESGGHMGVKESLEEA